MTGPYTTRGLWLYDPAGRRVALCYTLPVARELCDRLNSVPPPGPSVGAAGECLHCNAEQGQAHFPGCPTITGR